MSYSLAGCPRWKKARQQRPDAVILDVGLPDISGFELCRQLLERHPALPILFLTARSDEVDRLLGLEIGADDYVAKPFSPREVSARVRTLLRRVKSLLRRRRWCVPDILNSMNRRRRSPGLVRRSLTRYEFLLLKTLLLSPERVYSRQQLMDIVWSDARGDLRSGRSIHTSKPCALNYARSIRSSRQLTRIVEWDTA